MFEHYKNGWFVLNDNGDVIGRVSRTILTDDGVVYEGFTTDGEYVRFGYEARFLECRG